MDKEIKFDYIMEQILIPAYNAQKASLHEALAQIIGEMACIVSESATVIR